VLTTEEEGVGVLAGADLGGERGVLLMQSSGVGNCINSFTLLANCGFPFLTLITMRGEWAEFVPWQVPMGQTTKKLLELSGFAVIRCERTDEAGEAVAAAAALAFDGYQRVAVVLAQRLIGAKKFQ
jgi:sulfopyruvate decarboxylase TPP-binding subunit